MYKFQKLKNIANVITGYTFRGAVKEVSGSSLYVLQAKNIKDALFIDDNSLTAAEVDAPQTKAFVEDGDIVMGARGNFHSAIIKSSKKILAASSVYLLRVRKEDIFPEYLAIYLNSSMCKKSLWSLTTEAAIKVILRKDLENIKISVPPIEQQKKIIALYKNITEQGKLLSKKIKIQKNIMNGIFQKIAEE